MKLLLIRCGICYDWHSPNHHCTTCGAYHVARALSATGHINYQGVEMARGLPVNLDWTIARVIKRAQLQESAE